MKEQLGCQPAAAAWLGCSTGGQDPGTLPEAAHIWPDAPLSRGSAQLGWTGRAAALNGLQAASGRATELEQPQSKAEAGSQHRERSHRALDGDSSGRGGTDSSLPREK